jgi:hypothetical protein
MGSQIEVHSLENGARCLHNGGRFERGVLLKNGAWILAGVVLTASLGAVAGTGTSNGRKVYKWVDEQGMTHYGDHIPPEYAADEQHVINAQGVETDTLAAQKTPQQLAAEDQKKLEAEQRAGRDKNLLSTYVSVQEIERLRDQRLSLLTDQIKVTSQFLEILNTRLGKLRTSALRFKPYSSDPAALPMPDQVAEDLVRVGNDIHTQEVNLRQKRSEAAAMSQEFASDIERFKELRGIH